MLENGLDAFREKLKVELGAAGPSDAKMLLLSENVNVELVLFTSSMFTYPNIPCCCDPWPGVRLGLARGAVDLPDEGLTVAILCERLSTTASMIPLPYRFKKTLIIRVSSVKSSSWNCSMVIYRVEN